MQNQFLEMNFYKSENAFSKIKNAFSKIKNPFPKIKNSFPKLRKYIFFVQIKWPIVVKFIFIKKLYFMNKSCSIKFYLQFCLFICFVFLYLNFFDKL